MGCVEIKYIKCGYERHKKIRNASASNTRKSTFTHTAGAGSDEETQAAFKSLSGRFPK